MKRKWLLAIGLTLVLATVGLCGCSPGGASQIGLPKGLQVNLETQQQGIWVTGKGEVSVTPDIATLRLGVESRKATVAEAQAEASEAMDKVMASLKDSGVDEKDIQTRYFSIRQRTKWDRETDEEIVIGYQVTNTVSAKIRDIDKVGTIIDAAAEAGGDLVRIQGISFSVEKPSTYYAELREKAMADAEAKAKQLADLAGVTLGKATYVSEGIQAPRTWDMYDMYVGSMAPTPTPTAPPPISPGETKISLTLQVAYAILK
ncbi:MAG: SIMPL domain-containing protein [Chloroflexota bacterium]|nr:SIMPL domain-containing protein [Chloroflexota bacterium]